MGIQNSSNALAAAHTKGKNENSSTWINLNSFTLIKRFFSSSVVFCLLFKRVEKSKYKATDNEKLQTKLMYIDLSVKINDAKSLCRCSLKKLLVSIVAGKRKILDANF